MHLYIRYVQRHSKTDVSRKVKTTVGVHTFSSYCSYQGYYRELRCPTWSNWFTFITIAQMTLIIAMPWTLLRAWSSEGTYTKSGLLLYCLSWLDLIAFKPYVILFYACKVHFNILILSLCLSCYLTHVVRRFRNRSSMKMVWFELG